MAVLEQSAVDIYLGLKMIKMMNKDITATVEQSKQPFSSATIGTITVDCVLLRVSIPNPLFSHKFKKIIE